jgi:hypothetical protein
MQHQHQKAINTQPQENQAQLDDLSDITPSPWTVESHRDTEGGYIIREARHEQLSWCDEGYDISEEEGERRSLISTQHNTNNIRLIQAAPALFSALRNLLVSPDIGRAQAIELLEEISPHWREMKITCAEKEANL